MVAVHAGDVSSFVNLGFSPDGSRFVFGQYGSTDQDYRAYAEIFCVDVAKNSFIPGGRFTSGPAPETAAKDSRGVFAALQNSSAPFLAKLGIDSSSQGRALYVQAEDEPKLKNIAFRDFETGSSYAVTVNTLSEGSGAEVRTAFYLVVEQTSADGKVCRRTVGLPSLMRAGVRGYLVRRIITDASGRSLVFVVEKEIADQNGSSVRFMVETFRQ
jgi:Predicted secreted protein